MEFRDLKKQYEVLKPEMDAAIRQVLMDANYISGRQVAELEAALAKYVGVKHCITCANGTDALTLALMVLGIGENDAVFVPDFTFFSSAETVAYEGATPVFTDILEDTFNMDPDSLERADSKGDCHRGPFWLAGRLSENSSNRGEIWSLYPGRCSAGFWWCLPWQICR